MPVEVVDLLEPVDVEQDERHRALLTPGEGGRALE
jgi:hypothetical protein